MRMAFGSPGHWIRPLMQSSVVTCSRRVERRFYGRRTEAPPPQSIDLTSLRADGPPRAYVGHVLILMQENRSFDHYFGTLRGVRGFGDRHPALLASGKSVWFQSDGEREITPFRLDTEVTSALRAPSTPHTFADAQAAWNQGRFGLWPKFKTPMSMGYYQRDDIPFQFALAEAFTICDAHHCSVTTGTDPNRIVFWSGSNFDPESRRRGEDTTEGEAEVNNLRCLIKGGLPAPGYTYQGSGFTWPTLPEILERAGISWRIYQDPNDNWTGLMHGGLAFASFRNAKPGSALYEKGMSHWSLEQLGQDVKDGSLAQVSWVLPPQIWSEHPAPSSPSLRPVGLWTYGFLREFRGLLRRHAQTTPNVDLEYDIANHAVRLIASHNSPHEVTLVVRANAYRTDGPWPLRIAAGRTVFGAWALIASHHWYDFTVTGNNFERRFAGRLETGAPSFSDPAV
jgi:hypothetical protein